MNNNKIIIGASILIVLTIFITYKVTNQNVSIPKPEIQEYPVNSSKFIKEQENILNNITNNFNKIANNNNNFNKENKLVAIVEGNSIKVYYKNKNTDEQFDFILNDDTLISDISPNQNEEFKIVFKLIVKANQERIGNHIDLTNYFDKYLNNNSITEGIIITEENDIIEYIININKKINNTK